MLKNCNHYSAELIRCLFVGKKSVPAYCNRLACIGSFFSWILPLKFVTVGTPEGTEKETFERMKKWEAEDKIVNRSGSRMPWMKIIFGAMMGCFIGYL